MVTECDDVVRGETGLVEIWMNSSFEDIVYIIPLLTLQRS